ncbi:hypothetical protein [Cupriavidus sp. CuC1]|uniref:hypothetical protein n=1 Tax=Cupriavidus sp. CuC1 TaxID=3373131 RepID=UPI0037CF90E8
MPILRASSSRDLAGIVDTLNRGQALYALSGADAGFKTLAIEERDTDWKAEDMASNLSD